MRWSSERTRKLTALAMLTALAFVVAIVRIPVGLFIFRYEAKDVVIAIGGFIFGPLAVVAMSVVLSFLEMLLLSDTGPIGFFMNVISTVSFAGTAAVIYKYKRTLWGATIALVAGILVNVPIMLLWNYLIVPLFAPNIDREQVASMILPIFLPFNLLKGVLNATLTVMLYKTVRIALDKSRLIPATSESSLQNSKTSVAIMIVSIFLLITCILVILSWRGIF